ncbi:MAG: HD-GYP domain-containing protein, partial [Kangiellaceae bacterium]|nr:HD-GYP domain-containing protein [Kangiellaceae bacterium]
RFDGSGYPQGLQGTAIPLFARIASIVDCYDAITSDRPHRKGLSPSEAVKCLYEWRGKDFQTELIEEFIQAIGIYPAGSLVELSTGEVGVVLAEYRTRRLRPKLMMLLDKDKQLLANFSGLDLSEVLHDNDGKLLEIKRALEPGAYDIDPQTLYI